MEQVSEDITRSCQIISGTFFVVCVAVQLALNSDSPFQTKKLSVDRRLLAAVRMNTYVAIFSATFNFFQLTELDNFVLPRSTTFVLDMSRPVEWMCTCPLMQAGLVLMAGDAVPDYRLWMMPLLSFSVLTLGVVAVSISDQYARTAVFCLGSCVAMVMFYYNRKQILEFSYGEEGFFSGSSEFRSLSILLIMTWIPFPLWFLLSPEGVGVITDVGAIQVGWAVLNMIAKGTFLAYFQRVKSKHFAEMHRSMAEFSMNGDDLAKGSETKFLDASAGEGIDLHALLEETMMFLGLKTKVGKFKQLLKKARVTSCSDLDSLDELACRDAMLPWEVVYAMKRRLIACRMHGVAPAREEKAKEDAHRHVEHQAHISKLVSLAMGQDVEALQEAIALATKAGLDMPHLDLAQARVQETLRWKAVKEYLANNAGFKAALEGSDLAALQGAIEVADAAGLQEQATRGKGNLKDLSSRQAASKAAMKRGISLFKEQCFDAAETCFSEAIQHNPTNADAFLNRSAAHVRLRNWADAEADAAKAIELDPSNAKSHHSRALALHNLDDQQGALAACSVGLAEHPGNDPLLRLNDKIQAAIQAQQSVEEEEEAARLAQEEQERAPAQQGALPTGPVPVRIAI